MHTILLFVFALLPVAALAQTFKCIDAQKRVTYSNASCEKQGLTDAGPVADRIVTLPTVEVRKPATRPEAAKAPTPRSLDDAEVGRGSTQIKPIVPFMEKLAK
ncbi:MAG: DUF4124 domain-containing protein [Burkholderiales bacterium]